MMQMIAKMQGAMPVRRSQAAPATTSDDEQRKHGRSLTLYWDAVLKIRGYTGPATVLEISSGGMRMRSALGASAGVRVIVELPGSAPLVGEVRWLGGGVLGIRFDAEINVADIMRAHRKATGIHLGVDRKV